MIQTETVSLSLDNVLLVRPETEHYNLPFVRLRKIIVYDRPLTIQQNLVMLAADPHTLPT